MIKLEIKFRHGLEDMLRYYYNIAEGTGADNYRWVLVKTCWAKRFPSKNEHFLLTFLSVHFLKVF